VARVNERGDSLTKLRVVTGLSVGQEGIASN
jgi:hypothetical protein